MTEDWCRGRQGQAHDWMYIHPYGWPNCQPMRGWVRQRITAGEVRLKPGLYARQMAEDWECFHQVQCRRCRKKDRRSVFADECPVATGAEPAGPPEPST